MDDYNLYKLGLLEEKERGGTLDNIPLTHNDKEQDEEMFDSCESCRISYED